MLKHLIKLIKFNKIKTFIMEGYTKIFINKYAQVLSKKWLGHIKKYHD